MWWRKNGAQFPPLKILAKKYQAIPGSSVPSERLFTKAGEVISEKKEQDKTEKCRHCAISQQNLTFSYTVAVVSCHMFFAHAQCKSTQSDSLLDTNDTHSQTT